MLPVDPRPLEILRHKDMVPYERLFRLDLPSIMMAHVVFEQVDELPASLSKRWIGDELRRRMGFEGVVFCDDLSMRGAEKAGDYLDRAVAALDAGCDMLPVCNNRAGVDVIVKGLKRGSDPVSGWRLTRLHGDETPSWDELRASAEWKQARDALARYNEFGLS
jgi:beta-N-acetylhexosaminidase